MVDRARNAPVLLPRVPRPTRPRCWMALRPGLLRRGAVPRRKPWRGSPGANRRCAGWFCLFRTQRGRRAAAGAAAGSGAQAERAARAARNRVGAAGCLAGARAHGLAVLVELAGRDARRLGRGFVRSARRAGRLDSVLPSAASFLGVCGSEARRLAGRSGSRAASAAGLMLPGSWRNRISVLPRWCTGAQDSLSQISDSMASRASRSSPPARTLIRPWEVSARSISLSTASVRPLSPIRTTGRRGERRTEGRCARER